MRKLTKIILPEVGVGDLKIRPRGDNRCESANYMFEDLFRSVRKYHNRTME